MGRGGQLRVLECLESLSEPDISSLSSRQAALVTEALLMLAKPSTSLYLQRGAAVLARLATLSPLVAAELAGLPAREAHALRLSELASLPDLPPSAREALAALAQVLQDAVAVLEGSDAASARVARASGSKTRLGPLLQPGDARLAGQVPAQGPGTFTLVARVVVYQRPSGVRIVPFSVPGEVGARPASSASLASVASAVQCKRYMERVVSPPFEVPEVDDDGEDVLAVTYRLDPGARGLHLLDVSLVASDPEPWLAGVQGALERLEMGRGNGGDWLQPWNMNSLVRAATSDASLRNAAADARAQRAAKDAEAAAAARVQDDDEERAAERRRADRLTRRLRRMLTAHCAADYADPGRFMGRKLHKVEARAVAAVSAARKRCEDAALRESVAELVAPFFPSPSRRAWELCEEEPVPFRHTLRLQPQSQ